MIMKVYLSIGNGWEYSDFDFIKSISTISIFENDKKYNPDGQSITQTQSIKNLISEIKKTETDVLVYGSFFELKYIIDFKKRLKKTNHYLFEIYVLSAVKRHLQLLEGQELYRNHSRWLDFYPGEIEDIHKQREDNINEITKYFSSLKMLNKSIKTSLLRKSWEWIISFFTFSFSHNTSNLNVKLTEL